MIGPLVGELTTQRVWWQYSCLGGRSAWQYEGIVGSLSSWNDNLRCWAPRQSESCIESPDNPLSRHTIFFWRVTWVTGLWIVTGIGGFDGSMMRAMASWWSMTLGRDPGLRVVLVRDDAVILLPFTVTTDMREHCCWRMNSRQPGGISSQLRVWTFLCFLKSLICFFLSLEVLYVQLGAVHHAGLIGIRAYGFLCAAEVLGPGMGSTRTKALHLFTFIRFLGSIITITIKSLLCDAQKGSWTSNWQRGWDVELFPSTLIDPHNVKSVANFILRLDQHLKQLGEDASLCKCNSRASPSVIGVIDPESFDLCRINVGHKDTRNVDRIFLQIVKQPDRIKESRIVDLCS